MIYRNDREALARRDDYLTRGDDYDDYDTEECCTCGSEIVSGDGCYRIRNDFICRSCYEDLAEWIRL